MLPNYNASQLEEILDTEVPLPGFIDEFNYRDDFKDNPGLEWRVNFYLHKKETLEILLNESDFMKWKTLKGVNWLLFATIFAYILYFHVYWLLLFLMVYRSLVSLLISHGTFILLAIGVASCSFIFHFNTMDFWFAFVASILGFLLNKSITELVERIVFEKAFMSMQNFWKFYSNKLILIETIRSRRGYVALLSKYPELGES